MKSHDNQETGQKDTRSEQAEDRTAEALNEKHRDKPQQNNASTAFCVQATEGIQA